MTDASTDWDGTPLVLADRAVLRLTGTDRFTFLQGLVTNDVAPLGEGQAVFAGLLTPQGKIIADFFLLPEGDAILIDSPAAQADAIAGRLALYRLRAAIAIAPTDLAVIVADEGGHRDPRHPELGVRRAVPPADVPPARDAAYHARRIALAVPQGGRDYAYGDAFPHEAGYDGLHGVSFTKGCYTGQEIVARMQHRGTARTRPVAVRGAALGQGDEVLAAGHAIGRVGSVSGARGIALVRLDRIASPVTVGGAAAVLAAPRWASYALPLEPGVAAR